MRPILLAALACLVLLGCEEPQAPPTSAPPTLDPPAAATQWQHEVIGGPAPTIALDGLRWLARHQEPDGRWDCRRHGGLADEYASTAVTGLAILAFAGEGMTEDHGRFQDNIRRALDWLAKKQRANGAFSRNNYAHNIATLAVADSCGMTAKRQDMAKRAIAWLCKQQQPSGGWDYGSKGDPGRNRSDTSISSWAVIALMNARMSGLDISPEALENARRHFQNAGAGPDFAGSVAYAIEGDAKQPGTPALTAAAMYVQQIMGMQRDNAFLVQAGDALRERGPSSDNLYELFFGKMAMFLMGGDYWDSWLAGYRSQLTENQIREPGEHFGSWDPEGLAYGAEGGRVYATAMALICLEINYHYMPIYDQ